MGILVCCWLLLLVTLIAPIICIPLPRKIVDMTYIFDNDTLHHPMHKKFEIKVAHNGTYGDTDIWIQTEEYNSATHAGTHIDAPCHFIKGGWTVDQIPLENFISYAAVIDIEKQTEENPDYLLTIDDLRDWENKTGLLLNEVVIFMKSGWGKRWGNVREFYGTTGNDISQLHFPGMSREAAEWLVANRNVYGVGTETLSVDNGPSQDYPAHKILLGANIYILENVANVDQVPSFGSRIYVFPMNIGKASGAPARIIATFPILYT